MKQDNEVCVGCGSQTQGYEFVGIGYSSSAPTNGKGYQAAAFPVCKDCHQRPVRLKVHFCHRDQAAQFIAAAGPPDQKGLG